MTKPTRRTTHSGTTTGRTRVGSPTHHARQPDDAGERGAATQYGTGQNPDRNTNMMFLLKDFEKVFDVYIYQHSERSEATKMFVTLCTVPFVLMSIFGITNQVDLKATSFSSLAVQFPPIFFFIFVVFGAVGIVPFHRFVAAHCNQYKYTRYMNNYRLFYYQLIANELKDIGWRSAIEKDPLSPVPKYFSLHWSTFFAYVMAGLNTVYITLGLYLWDGTGSNIVPSLAFLISIAIHATFAISELRTDDVAFLRGDSTTELLKKIKDQVK